MDGSWRNLRRGNTHLPIVLLFVIPIRSSYFFFTENSNDPFVFVVPVTPVVPPLLRSNFHKNQHRSSPTPVTPKQISTYTTVRSQQATTNRQKNATKQKKNNIPTNSIMQAKHNQLTHARTQQHQNQSNSKTRTRGLVWYSAGGADEVDPQ